MQNMMCMMVMHTCMGMGKQAKARHCQIPFLWIIVTVIVAYLLHIVNSRGCLDCGRTYPFVELYRFRTVITAYLWQFHGFSGDKKISVDDIH